MAAKMIVAAVAAAAASALPLGTYTLQRAGHQFRHCNYQSYATPPESGNGDFIFEAVPALNGNANGVSFQSSNYPSMFIALLPPASGIEAGRLGIVTSPNPSNASWLVVPGLANASQYSLQSLSTTPAFAGLYVTQSTSLSGSCSGNYPTGSGDVVLTDGKAAPATATWELLYTPPPPPPNVTIDFSSVVRTIPSLYTGCHFDPGYTNQVQAFYSNLIYGETPSIAASSWDNVVSTGGATGTHGLDTGVRFGKPNLPSLRVTAAAGGGTYGVAHRGIGNEGLSIAGGRDYNGYIFVQAAPGTPVTLSLQDRLAGTTLATATATTVGAAGAWQRLNFTFASTSAGAACAQIPVGSDPTVSCSGEPNADHVCVRCGGQFAVAVPAGATLHIGFAFLQPGSWGTFAGLPVKKGVVDLLKTMGIGSIRQGGTVSQTFRWKNWTGPPEGRGALGHVWGRALVSGWGPFEIIDMCNAAGIEPIITLAQDLNNAADWADLVEYLYGGAGTTWGAQRIADGHPATYKITTFELGNEQYNPNFVEQVTAMEARVKAVGAPDLHYMFPTNDGLNSGDAAKATAAGLPIARIMPDIHVGAGGAVAVAQADFAKLPDFKQSAINCETNADAHDMGRALGEADDLNTWFNLDATLGPRLFARTASFCTERSGYFDGFDQGIAFFNATAASSSTGYWLQPPGYVHAMLAATWADQALTLKYATTPAAAASAASVPGAAAQGVSISAQKTADGKALWVRMVNTGATPAVATLTVANAPAFSPRATVWTLAAPAGGPQSNPPSNPTAVSPAQSSAPWVNGGNVNVPASSVVFVGLTVA